MFADTISHVPPVVLVAETVGARTIEKIGFPVRFAESTAFMCQSPEELRTSGITTSSALSLGARTQRSDQAVARVFQELLHTWREGEDCTDRMIDRAMHPAYLRIIGLGPQVIPLILNELVKEPDPWFWALEALTGESPIPPKDQGDVSKMTATWLEWGRTHGYLA